MTAAGTITFAADLTYTDNTTTTGNVQLTVPADCKNLSGTSATCAGLGAVIPLNVGFDSTSSCVDATSGGGCTCQANANQSGWLGVVSGAASTGNGDQYTASSNVLTLTTSNSHTLTATYSYCVSGNTLTLTPTPTSMTLAGTIVLTKQ